MKLAEALMERAELQKRISQMEDRLRNNAQVQEGETPAEDPGFLLAQLSDMLIRLEELTAQVNLTNSAVIVDGEPLTRQSEIKILSTVPVKDMQRELDRRSKALRELDAKIQAANWTWDLIEK